MGKYKKVQVGKDQEKAQSEKRFPLQKPRWEKKHFYCPDIFSFEEMLFPRQVFCTNLLLLWFYLFYVLKSNFCAVLTLIHVRFHSFSQVQVTEWKIAAHSAYDMLSKYKYLIVNLIFSHLGVWCGNFFLVAHFPGDCLLVPY